MWICQKCGNQIDDSFKECWKCAESKLKGIGGLLSLYILGLVVGNPIILIINTIQVYFFLTKNFSAISKTLFIYITTFTIIDVFLLFGSIYAGIVLLKIKKDAVKINIIFLITIIVIRLLSLLSAKLMSLPFLLTDELSQNFLLSLFFCVFWIFYLRKSKRVKNTYAFKPN